MVAAAVAGSAVIGAGASLIGSSQAASSAKAAQQLQQQQFQTTRGDLLPYNTTGQNALSGAYNLASGSPTGGGPDYVSMAQGMLPGQMTEAELQNTPGYQFQLGQGLKAVQNSAAAKGLGVSGTAMKGAANFATGLADSNYQNQFANAQTRFGDVGNLNTMQQGNLQNQFNRLSGIATLGENAAAQTGAQGTQAASAGGNYLNQAGLAQAAGTSGVNSALTGAANNYLAYNAYQQRTAALGGNVGTLGYGTSAAGTPGISAAGNPVMTGYAPAITPGTNYLGFQG